MEFTLLFAAVVGVGSAWLAARILRRRPGSSIPDQTFELALNAAVVGLVVGRVWAMVTTGTNPLTHLGDLIVIRGGVDPGGAALGALAALVWTARHDRRETLDGVAPVALWGLAGWHAGCVFTGSCLGAASSLPWAMTQAGSDVGRHPTEVYAALMLAVGAFVLGRLVFRRAGVAAATALLIASGVRLVTEPLRLSLGGGRSTLYLIGCGVGAGALAWSLRRAEAPGQDA